MYCIIHRPEGFKNIYYLAWQNPVWDDNGYFWASKKTVKEILCNNTPDHPFLFNSKAEAISHLKSINIPQKCTIIKWAT